MPSVPSVRRRGTTHVPGKRVNKRKKKREKETYRFSQIRTDASWTDSMGLHNVCSAFPCSSPSSAIRALKMEQVLEGPLWEAQWPYMCVPEILQARVAAQNSNNAGKHGPYCELFFCLMKHEPADGEAQMDLSSGLCDYMRAVESRSTDPKAGIEGAIRANGWHST